MKNLKFSFSYESTGNEITQFCRDKEFDVFPEENCDGLEVIEIFSRMVNQLIEVGMSSNGEVKIEDDVIYIEYEITNEEELTFELKEVFMVSQLDFTRRIDVFGPYDNEELKFDFEYKSLGDNLTNLITDKEIKVDLCSNCTFEEGILVISTLIQNKLIEIGIKSKGKVEIEDEIIYIEYSTTQKTGDFVDKKVYPKSVLNFNVKDDDDF